MAIVNTTMIGDEDYPEADDFKLFIDHEAVLDGCGCCGSPRIGTAKYPAKDLAEVIEKAVQEYVNSKEPT